MAIALNLTMADSVIHRHIEGGNAGFLAGCALSGFNLRPSIRITNKLSIKADANTILISCRPSWAIDLPLMKAALQSVAGALRFCHRSHPTIRGRWPTNVIAGFYQPEHVHAALKHFSGDLNVEACLVYTVYFTAPEELSDAVLLDVEDIVSQTLEARIVWEEPRDGMVTLRLSGTNQESVVDMKNILEAIYSGRVATEGIEIWHDFFATAPGGIWLQHLARDMGVIIMSDKLQRRLRIYASEENGKDVKAVLQHLGEKVTKLEAQEESHTIRFDPGDFRKLLVSDKVAKAQVILGKSNVSLDILKKTLVLHCTRQTAWLIAFELDLLLPANAEVPPVCPQCGDTTNEIKLSACGHVACKECFTHQLHVAASDLTGNHFPLVCWHENCKRPVAISDLRKYATGKSVDALFKASLTYYIRSFPDIYRNCRTPDCTSVYLRNDRDDIFTCPTCLTQTCVACHAEPHVGWTCDKYQAHLRKNQYNEKLLDDYKAIAGTKECPKCATLIEKIDGCNHVECSGCHGHICWACLKVFARSETAYQHMNDAHGGNGLGEGEEDASDFDSDEDESSESDGSDGGGGWENVYENW
jgi:hypothetical protein